MSVEKKMQEDRVKQAARRELSLLDSSELTQLILETVDCKTLSVVMTSLRVSRERVEKDAKARRTGERTNPCGEIPLPPHQTRSYGNGNMDLEASGFCGRGEAKDA